MEIDSADEARIVSSLQSREDEAENTLRPKTMDEYIGQDKIKSNLLVYINAAKKRGDALDHVLLYGPPGLGKTTLAHIIASELGAQIHVTSGPAIEKAADLASILSNLEKGDILFIDEIHRLNRNIEEVLYPAMEDYGIDFMFGKGPSARSVRLSLPQFTLIGATTRAGMLSSPLRDRFGVILRLESYTPDDLKKIITRSAGLLNISIESEAGDELSKRSRGTPRIANRLLKRVRDFADYENLQTIDSKITRKALRLMEVDGLGLDLVDRTILETMIKKFNGGPVGLDTLSAATNEEQSTIEDIVEPYLMQLGFICRTPRGRVCLRGAYEHLGFAFPMDKAEELKALTGEDN
ncbi:MAG TPA: Holliday junction branch migration DNA helicase RuvB [Clostridia bacterium]|nr:Holliday junction branch migration DNA helicase RuvB [Clostridia bacterium]